MQHRLARVQLYRVQIPVCGGIRTRRPAVIIFRKQVSARVYQELSLFRVPLHNRKAQRCCPFHIQFVRCRHNTCGIDVRRAVDVRACLNRRLNVRSRSVYHRVEQRVRLSCGSVRRRRRAACKRQRRTYTQHRIRAAGFPYTYIHFALLLRT